MSWQYSGAAGGTTSTVYPKGSDLVYSERAEPEFLPAGSATLTLQEILLPALIQSWITTYRCFLLYSYEL